MKKKITVQVEFCVEVPESTENDCITMAIDTNKIIVHDHEGVIKNAKVFSYTTTQVFEDYS